jgi:hypothetical protein
MFLGLSKYSRTRPLLDALHISSITELYLKFKCLFAKQIKNNSLVSEIFDEIKSLHPKFKISKLSYVTQFMECGKELGIDILNTKKKDLLCKLSTEFGCPDTELVDSIRSLLYNHENCPNYRDELRSLVWVDFGT